MANLRNQVFLYAFIGTAFVAFGLLGYDEITKQPVDDIIKELIAFIIGALSTYLSNAQGVQNTQQTTALAKNGGTSSASPPPP